jgi:hypothetical protein
MYHWLAAVSLLGTVTAIVWQGWRAGTGFALGAALSAINFRVLHRLVGAMGTGGSTRPRKRIAALIGLRYLILGSVAYVIVRIFHLDGLPVVTGFLCAAAAVLIEIIYELLYART